MKYCLLLLILFVSCEGFIGEDGVVVDANTGERIEGVYVSMNSDLGSKETITDSIGFFNTNLFVNCGLSNCDENFTITFEKQGYVSKTINDSYYYSEDTEFVTIGTKDTLLIKLNHN